jgi:NADPH2:quinone reductase
VRDLTGGEGVDAVFDGVGQSTWEGSLASVRPRGVLVSFGEASGPVPPLEMRALAARGSIYLTSPTLATYTQRRDELIASSKELFDVLARGVVRVSIGATWALRDAEEAHRALEARQTTGSTVLLP